MAEKTHKKTKKVIFSLYRTSRGATRDNSLNVMTIYRYIDAGKLKAYKIGKEFRIERSEFERFMNKAKTK